MLWTSANVRNPDYNGQHEIFVGGQTGSFKNIRPGHEENPFRKRNLCDLSTLNENSRIQVLEFGNEERSEILVGRKNNSVELRSVQSEDIVRTVNCEADSIVGLARYKDLLIAGSSNGQVQCIPLEQGAGEEFKFSTGDDLSRLRQCSVQRNFIATGGKERKNNLKVFDIEAGGKQVFTSKNLAHDELQLQVPVWDTDIGFLDAPHTLATCSRYGYVRIYDTRKQRRPVQRHTSKEQMSFTCLTAKDNYIYVGTTMGGLRALDIRKMKAFVHTYRGFTGAISGLYLDEAGKYLASASLDRYVRMHHVDSSVLLYQCYVKSKATQILICNSQKPTENERVPVEESDVPQSQKTGEEGEKDVDLSEDEEYNTIFANMQTVRDDSEEDDVEEETKTNVKKKRCAAI